MPTTILRLEEALYKCDYSDEPMGKYEFPARTVAGRKGIPFSCRECIWFEDKVPLFCIIVRDVEDTKHVVRAAEGCTCLVMHGDVFFPSGRLGMAGLKHVILMRDDDQPFALPEISPDNALLVCVYGNVMRRLDGVLDAEVSSGGYFSRHRKGDESELCTLLVGHTDVCVDFATISGDIHKNMDITMKQVFISHPSPLFFAVSSRIKSVLIKLHNENIEALPKILDTPATFKKLTEPRRRFTSSEIFAECYKQDVYGDTFEDRTMLRHCDDEMQLDCDSAIIRNTDVQACIGSGLSMHEITTDQVEHKCKDCSGLYWSQ